MAFKKTVGIMDAMTIVNEAGLCNQVEVISAFLSAAVEHKWQPLLGTDDDGFAALHFACGLVIVSGHCGGCGTTFRDRDHLMCPHDMLVHPNQAECKPFRAHGCIVS